MSAENIVDRKWNTISKGVIDVRLGGKMEDGVDMMMFKDVTNKGGIRDVCGIKPIVSTIL